MQALGTHPQILRGKECSRYWTLWENIKIEVFYTMLIKAIQLTEYLL